MKKTILYSLLSVTLYFTSCVNHDDSTEPSQNMGAQSAEGGTSPNISSMQDSLARNRAGGAEQNSGVSQPTDGNTGSSGTSTTAK